MATDRAKLDALERRLTGPKRIALFGHRAVGKTTLLAMFYREASSGRIENIRLAATDSRTAEYLADKIERIDAGESPAGTLSETELALRLYRGPAKIDLIVRDYQGEHVGLGSEAEIFEFFKGCDAVLLCLDPEGSDSSAGKRRRQQEVEFLIEQYLGSSEDTTIGRPIALLVTKYDQVLAEGGPEPDRVEELVVEHYGMTRYAIESHAPRSGLFAVSSYGTEGSSDGIPPSNLEPMGLEGPIRWLVDELEQTDRELLDWLFDLAPNDRPRLKRAFRAFARRYPHSPRLIEYRRRLRQLGRFQSIRGVGGALVSLLVLIGGLAAYDAIGYHFAVEYEQGGYSPVEVHQNWQSFLQWHPTQWIFWPDESKDARERYQSTLVQATLIRNEAGSEPYDRRRDELVDLKVQAPEHREAINEAESELDRQEAESRWREIHAEALVPSTAPEERLELIRTFLREYPDSPQAESALKLATSIQTEFEANQSLRDRELVDAWKIDAKLPDPDYQGLIEQARIFLQERPASETGSEVRTLMEEWLAKLDERDFQRALAFEESSSRSDFDEQIRRYRNYLIAHESGGQFAEQAKEAIDRIEVRRDTYLYRIAYDHWSEHPSDLPEVARRLQAYRDASPEGAYRSVAKRFIGWWDRIRETQPYEVTLVRGAVDSDFTKRMAGAGPNLSVTVWVNGRKYGPSPVIPDRLEPVWNYRFPGYVKWKYGDDVLIKVVDHDWSDTTIATLRSGDDPLAIRVLSGIVQPSKQKGKILLEFRSNFRMPSLTAPSE